MSHAVDAHPAPMEMFERHPEGHERAGRRISRPRDCACGTRFFQAQLSPAWLDRMPAHQSKLFVDQATTIEKDGTVWLPNACPSCERKALNAPQPKPENK